MSFSAETLEYTGAILKSKDMRAVFRKRAKKGKKMFKKCLKRAKYLKNWGKMYKI